MSESDKENQAITQTQKENEDSVKFLKPLSIVLLFILGGWLGYILNDSLSVGFLQNPSYDLLIIGLVNGIVPLFVIFWKTRNPNYPNFFDKLRYVFLGISLISLATALQFFVSLVQNYFAVLAQSKAVGGALRIEVDPSLFIGVFKSLLLTGLFSFLERFLRIIEDTKQK